MRNLEKIVMFVTPIVIAIATLPIQVCFAVGEYLLGDEE